MRTALALFLVLAAGAVRADQNCRQMEWMETRFRGVVRAVEILGARELTVTPVEREVDPRYAVTIDVAGEEKIFAIHSPSRTFGSGDLVGQSFDLAMLWTQCDGRFRRTEELRVVTELVEPYERSIEVGHTYRAVVRGRELEPPVQLPMHHGGGVEWTNADAFLPEDGRARTVVFHVGHALIAQRGDRLQFMTLYRATVVRVESADHD